MYKSLARTTPRCLNYRRADHLQRSLFSSKAVSVEFTDRSPLKHPSSLQRSTLTTPRPRSSHQNISHCRSVSSNAATKRVGTGRPLPEFDLSGKVILVSGAARGLGLVQAEALLEAGATVYALDMASEPSKDFLRIASNAESELNTSLKYRRVDVRDTDGLKSTIAAIGDIHGRLDGLIAAAGIQQETSALSYTAADANKMFEVNVTGAFMTAQAAALTMQKHKSPGSILLVASMSGTIANRGLPCAPYNSSKAAVQQLARSLAAEWGSLEAPIRVNSLSPGYIVTDMVAGLFERFPERREAWASQNMLGRLSTPQEFRGVSIWAMGSGSSFLTGSDLRVDGGHAAW